MCDVKRKIFQIDDDAFEVLFHYDRNSDMYFGSYPDFAEEPRFTPNGRPWVNTMHTDCPHCTDEYGDCGTCKFFLTDSPGDLIGVCTNEALRKEQLL